MTELKILQALFQGEEENLGLNAFQWISLYESTKQDTAAITRRIKELQREKIELCKKRSLEAKLNEILVAPDQTNLNAESQVTTQSTETKDQHSNNIRSRVSSKHAVEGWTDYKILTLKKMWDEGFSASQIASKLGGLGRNSVIGKVHRLGLSGRVRPETEAIRSKRIRTRNKRQTRSGDFISLPSTLEEPFNIPESKMLSLLELTEATCRWPHGDPTTDMHFCGNRTEPDTPYCKYHEYHAKMKCRKIIEGEKSKVTGTDG